MNLEIVKALRDAGVTTMAMELMPRITRAQSMDILSSQATVAGYKAVLLGANAIGKFLPMLTTAAGTVRPAKTLTLGAGVAGLQVLATFRRLGAVMEAFDVRPAVKEQCESLGAKFLELDVGDMEDEGGYAKELSEDQHEREMEMHRRVRQGQGRGHHHGPDPWPEGADSHHQGHGGEHEARLGHRGPGRRDRRELRAHQGR